MKRLTAVVASAAFVLAVSPVNVLALAADPTAPVPQGQLGAINGVAGANAVTPVGNATAQLVSSTGATVGTTSTSAAGAFSFVGVAPGTYTVNIVQTFLVNGVQTNVLVGVNTVVVAAGATATVTVTTTSAALAAFAAVGGTSAGAAAAAAAAAAATTGGAAAGSAAAALILSGSAAAATVAAATTVAVANAVNDASASR